MVGAYVCAELKDGQFLAKEIGLFHRDGHPNEVRILERLVKAVSMSLALLKSSAAKSS